VSGFPLGYHLGTDLVRAAALRWAGTDPWDSLTRLDVTLWALGLVLGLRALARRLGAPPLAVALVPWTLLLTDLSFVFAANPQAHWWTDLLRGNLLLSLVYANPLVPALGLVLGALSRSPSSRTRAAAATWPWPRSRRSGPLLQGLPRGPPAPGPRRRLARRAPAPRGGAARGRAALRPRHRRPRPRPGRRDGGRRPRAPRPRRGDPGDPGPRAARRVPALVAWAAFWLAASLGLRLFGIPEAVRSLRGPATASCLAAMALSGWPLGLLFRVSAPEVLPGQSVVNDAAYLVEQSGPLLWVVRRGRLARLATSASAGRPSSRPSSCSPPRRPGSTPSRRRPPRPTASPPPWCAPPAPSSGLATRGRRPPAAARALPARPGRPRRPPRALRALHAVPHPVRLARRPRGPPPRGVPLLPHDEPGGGPRHRAGLDASFLALYDLDRVRFDTAGLLEPVHEEPEARLYRIRYGRPPRPALKLAIRRRTGSSSTGRSRARAGRTGSRGRCRTAR
jgi:hypothetical protein